MRVDVGPLWPAAATGDRGGQGSAWTWRKEGRQARCNAMQRCCCGGGRMLQGALCSETARAVVARASMAGPVRGGGMMVLGRAYGHNATAGRGWQATAPGAPWQRGDAAHKAVDHLGQVEGLEPQHVQHLLPTAAQHKQRAAGGHVGWATLGAPCRHRSAQSRAHRSAAAPGRAQGSIS